MHALTKCGVQVPVFIFHEFYISLKSACDGRWWKIQWVWAHHGLPSEVTLLSLLLQLAMSLLAEKQVLLYHAGVWRHMGMIKFTFAHNICFYVNVHERLWCQCLQCMALCHAVFSITGKWYISLMLVVYDNENGSTFVTNPAWINLCR